MYKAVIFDMDGTIVDTERVWGAATCKLLEEKRIPCTPELLQLIRTHIQGLDVVNSCRVIKEITGMTDDVKTLCEEKEALAHGLYEAGITYLEGFVEFHNKLRERGIKTAIATNARSLTIHLTQNALNIRHFFGEHVYGLDDVAGKGKPNPDIYLLAASKINVNPQLCVVVEDSAHGIAAGQAAGMFCIGINSSGNKAQTQHADLMIDGYVDINIDMLFESLDKDMKGH